MLIALIDGERAKATPDLHKQYKSLCPGCLNFVVARCGDQKVWHWAHAKNSDCPVGAGETAWHLHWKTLVQAHEAEVQLPYWPNNRADICLDLEDDYCVVELQHSGITGNTIREREAAYENMVWVVDVRGRNFLRTDRGLEWSHASKVWLEATKPVIFDNGTSWTVLLRGKWRKFGSGSWFFDPTTDLRNARAANVQRPTDRKSFVEAIFAARAAIKKNEDDIAKYYKKLAVEREIEVMANYIRQKKEYERLKASPSPADNASAALMFGSVSD